MSFAKYTSVSSGKTIEDIKKRLKKFGAEKFMNMETNELIMIAFQIKGKSIKMTIPIPSIDLEVATKKKTDKFEQSLRTRWRCLLLVVKGKIESVEMNIETFEQAFLPYFTINGGETIGEKLIPLLEDKIIKSNLLEYFQ